MYMKLRNYKGFTLLEMLTVLFLMVLLLTMVMPVIQQTYQQIQMDTAIQQLHKDIRWAQRQAENEQIKVSIMFFQDKQPYRYVIRFSGNANVLRRRELPNQLLKITAQTIFVEPDRTFQKNGHILLQKGDIQRYVYYYQTGRTRVAAAPI